MKPEHTATTSVKVATCAVGLVPARASARARASTTPALSNPRLTTSTAATVTTAAWPNPANACSAGTTPATATINSANSATTS